jgi:hypothetical protein
MTKQVLYPKYATFIVIYACIFVTTGVLFARLLEKLFPKFDEKNKTKKHKSIIFIEILLQISSIAVITYIFREYTNYFIESIDFFKKHTYGSPDKFAALIIAPTMFTVQPSLIKKINYLANSSI